LAYIVANKSLKQENLQLAVFTAFNILANYKFPLNEALGVFQIWRFTNIMDNQFKISGWAFTVYGAIVVLAFMFAYYYGVTQYLNVQSIPSGIKLLVSLLFVVNLLAFLCGIYLLKENTVVHKFALPVSIVMLLSFPFGTFVGGLYLWERFKST
jgi:hypothetical protein